MSELTLVIITGLSGSGKSTASRALEDLGYFCVDNLPPALLGTFTELCRTSAKEISRVCTVMDVREGVFLEDLPPALGELEDEGQQVEICYLEASDETLIQRFSATRRQHPLTGDETLLDGLAREKEKLAELRALADTVIDTSDLNIHQLKEIIQDRYGVRDEVGRQLTVTLLSFGFKHGVPPDAASSSTTSRGPTLAASRSAAPCRRSSSAPSTASYIAVAPLASKATARSLGQENVG